MNKKGFTLMELLIVVVIIAGLAAVTYPSYKSNLERARASEAVNIIGTIQAAQQKHFINYEEYGTIFRDINDFEPAINNFNPNSNTFDTEYFRYTLRATARNSDVIAQRIDDESNLVNKGYNLTGVFTESFIRCNFTNDDGEKVCSSLTDRNAVSTDSGKYYPIF